MSRSCFRFNGKRILNILRKPRNSNQQSHTNNRYFITLRILKCPNNIRNSVNVTDINTVISLISIGFCLKVDRFLYSVKSQHITKHTAFASWKLLVTLGICQRIVQPRVTAKPELPDIRNNRWTTKFTPRFNYVSTAESFLTN